MARPLRSEIVYHLHTDYEQDYLPNHEDVGEGIEEGVQRSGVCLAWQ